MSKFAKCDLHCMVPKTLTMILWRLDVMHQDIFTTRRQYLRGTWNNTSRVQSCVTQYTLH